MRQAQNFLSFFVLLFLKPLFKGCYSQPVQVDQPTESLSGQINGHLGRSLSVDRLLFSALRL